MNENDDSKNTVGMAVGAGVGASAGIAGTIAAVSATGTTAGLSGAGITSGLAAIGGGTMLGGLIVATGGVALLAVGCAYIGAKYWGKK
ncbi:MAG TPA: hypothetical protein PLB55_14320 [Prosthecobacter sp.]|jgi:hypothetical protein|nr:hypothetical protein [Prosthecobacter sp.]